MKASRLRAYANLIVSQGIAPTKGQQVLILAGLDQPDFVQMVAEECYACGAAKVSVDWYHMPLQKLGYEKQSDETLATIEKWELAKLQWRVDQLPAFIWLDSDDPEGMDGIDQSKRARAQRARFPLIKPLRDAMENKYQWCIAGIPGRKWSRKVFPGLSDEEAMERLWEAILDVSRVTEDAKSTANAWEEHNRLLHTHADKLNGLHLSFLEYHSSNGTEFRVGLIPQARFAGGSEKDLSLREFNPNIPTEEVFISPERGVAEGVVVATKPLSWQGTLIEDFSIRFKDGKAVEVHATKGQDALEKMISLDDGAAYLGECALIGYDSPINRTGILFYNTLYDENASCHLALGRGFENCIDGYDKYSLDDLRKMGINDSMIHVDFMIGAGDLDITGIQKDGTRIPIFRDGEWVI